MGVYKRYTDMPGQILYRDGTSARPQDYEQFRVELARLPQHAAHYWEVLNGQDPLIRLKINMQHTIGCIVDRSVMTVIPEGVEPRELTMLEALAAISSISQLVGHELLNLRERQLFVDKFRIVFNAYRCRRA